MLVRKSEARNFGPFLQFLSLLQNYIYVKSLLQPLANPGLTRTVRRKSIPLLRPSGTITVCRWRPPTDRQSSSSTP